MWFCARVCRRDAALWVWVEQGEEGGKGKEDESLLSSLPSSVPPFLPPARARGRAQPASAGGRGRLARRGGAGSSEGGFSWVSGGQGPPGLPDLLSTFLLRARRPSRLGRGLLACWAEGSRGGRLLWLRQPLLLLSCVWLRLLPGLHASGSFHFTER